MMNNLKLSDAQNLLVDVGRERRYRWWRIDQLPRAELPHDPLLGHYLNGHIEDDLRLCHPVRTISIAEVRDPAGVPCMHGGGHIGLPDHRPIIEHVELLGERRVAVPDLVASKSSLRREIVSTRAKL